MNFRNLISKFLIILLPISLLMSVGANATGPILKPRPFPQPNPKPLPNPQPPHPIPNPQPPLPKPQPQPQPFNPCLIDKNSYACLIRTFEMTSRDQKIGSLFSQNSIGEFLKQACTFYMFRSSQAPAGEIFHGSELQIIRDSGAALNEIQKALNVWPADLSGERAYLLQLITRLNLAPNDKFTFYKNEIIHPYPASADTSQKEMSRLIAIQKCEVFEQRPDDLEQVVDQVLQQEPQNENQVVMLKHFETIRPEASRRLALRHKISLPPSKLIKPNPIHRELSEIN